MKIAQKGFAHVGLIVLAVVVLLIGVSGWFVYTRNNISSPEPSIVPQQQAAESNESDKSTQPETNSYKIEELGIYIDLEPNWTVDKKVNPEYEETKYTITGNNGSDKPVEAVSIIAFQSKIPAGFSGCNDDSEMVPVTVTELSDTQISDVVVFGTDISGLALTSKTTQYASKTKSLVAPRLTISELEVGSTYYLCQSATPPVAWDIDFDSDESNQDGVYASVEGDAVPSKQMSGYGAVVKMLRSVRR